MRRLCIIGNSHSGALKAAWDAVAESYPNWAVDFFASTFLSLDDFVLTGDRVLARTQIDRERFRRGANGAESIVAAKYDAFALVGLGPAISKLAFLLGEYRPHGLATGKTPLVSRGCIKAAIRDTAQKMIGLQLARWLRPLTDAPIHVIAPPLCSDGIVKAAKRRTVEWGQSDKKKYQKLLRGHEALADRRLQSEIYALWREVCREIEARETFSFQPQPADTIVNHAYTDHRFARQSVGMLGLSKGEVDFFHMNADYGSRVIGALMGSLSQSIGACGKAAYAILSC